MKLSGLRRVHLEEVPDQGLLYPGGDAQAPTSGVKGCLFKVQIVEGCTPAIL
jgi:hypothetical protein